MKSLFKPLYTDFSRSYNKSLLFNMIRSACTALASSDVQAVMTRRFYKDAILVGGMDCVFHWYPAADEYRGALG